MNLRALSMVSALVAAVALLPAVPVDALEAGFDPEDPHRKIRVPWSQVPYVSDVGLEGMGAERNAWVDFLARNAELAELDARGINYTILVPNLEEQGAERASLSRGGGNFGIFHTYDEMIVAIDALHAAYPSITTDKQVIGTTWEGRAIYAMKISDNPNVDEDEPEVLFDAVHHAREIMTVEVILDYMNWLCSNYGTDPEATLLVDTREIWFVPVVNPDGFVYNETTNPLGGGLWRKNRRDDLGVCVGVDLNRNYPFEWGNTSGASPDPCSDVYFGPGSASELETQAMINFINSHEFVTHNSYHSVAALILHPWGYTFDLHPEWATFQALGSEMSRDNGYPVGTAGDLLGYLASGGTFDWAYAEQTSKPKIYAYTTEVGGSAFWPAESERPGLLAENLYSNVVLTRAAGVSLVLDTFEIAGGDANGRLDAGETADLVLTLRNFGVAANATGVTMTLASDDSYVALNDATSSVPTVLAMSTADAAGDPFTVTAAAGTPAGHVADLMVTIDDGAGSVTTANVALAVGVGTILYAQDFEAGSDWTTDPGETASTGTFVRIDPNGTSHQPSDDATPSPGLYGWITAQNPSSAGVDDVDGGTASTLSPVVDLSGVGAAQLSFAYFHGQRDPGDDAGDFFRIDLSNDGGATFPANLVLEGDVTSSPLWTNYSVELGGVLPLTSQMRLRVQAADGPATGDIVEGGIDDVLITEAGSGNLAPGVPTLISPADGATGQPAAPTLVVAPALDPEADPLTYTFRVYSDSLLTNEVAAVSGVAEAGGTVSWMVSPSLTDGTYYWRAHASDAEQQGSFMAAASFEVTGATDVSVVAGVNEALLAPPSPNPSRGAAEIVFTMPRRDRVRIDVFDLAGRHVLRLFEGVAEAGPNTRRWDGRNKAGGYAAGGIYFVQMEMGGYRQTQKVVRLP